LARGTGRVKPPGRIARRRAAGDLGRCDMSFSAGLITDAKRTNALFELEALEGLPCGCVAAAYRARPWDVAVVSLEAKGPHCILHGHTQGQILRLGDLADLEVQDGVYEDEGDQTYTP
jgi:hypothetical protein